MFKLQANYIFKLKFYFFPIILKLLNKFLSFFANLIKIIFEALDISNFFVKLLLKVQLQALK